MHKQPVWAIVPAAGIGKRMQTACPKQYLELLGEPVLLHTLKKLAAVPEIAGIAVVISAQDTWWPTMSLQLKKPIVQVTGGRERPHSVFNAVRHLEQTLQVPAAWFLVHDAARPCVRRSDIKRLINTLSTHPCGGLLAARVRDTMKRSDETAQVIQTVDRHQLWHALTPQMFRAELLHRALEEGLEHPELITDEASALERLGYRPLLVEGRMDNIKITQPEDLQLARLFLEQEYAEQ